jgi:hypothetical protein
MGRVLRHKTVQLDTGGWVDLKGCNVLWSARTGATLLGSLIVPRQVRWLVRSLWPYSGVGADWLLLRTPQGSLVLKELVGPIVAFTSRRVVWREVDETQAYLWLRGLSPRQAHRAAQKIFPEIAALHRAHQLPGER